MLLNFLNRIFVGDKMDPLAESANVAQTKRKSYKIVHNTKTKRTLLNECLTAYEKSGGKLIPNSFKEYASCDIKTVHNFLRSSGYTFKAGSGWVKQKTPKGKVRERIEAALNELKNSAKEINYKNLMELSGASKEYCRKTLRERGITFSSIADKRQEIFEAIESQLKVSSKIDVNKIVKDLNINPTTVRKWVKRFNEK